MQSENQRAAAISTLAFILLWLSPAQGNAKAVIAAEPAINQAIYANLVVVGKVVEIEKDLVEARRDLREGWKSKFQVAVIKVEETLGGPKGLTHVRVGFIPSLDPRRENGSIPIRGNINTNLPEGREGCFFLMKHHEADFYTLRPYAETVDRSVLGYDNTMHTVRKMLRAFEDPMTALKAKDPADRQLAAAALIHKYRSTRDHFGVKVKQVAVPAEETRLILEALVSSQWTEPDASVMHPQTAFWLLGLTSEHGWQQVPIGKDYNKALETAVAKWVKEHGAKFTLQRFVVDKPK